MGGNVRPINNEKKNEEFDKNNNNEKHQLYDLSMYLGASSMLMKPGIKTVTYGNMTLKKKF